MPDLKRVMLNNTSMDVPVGVKYSIVNALPSTGEAATIYFVPKENPTQESQYDKYVYVNGRFESLGGGGNLGVKHIDESGTYYAADDGLDGYSEVIVFVTRTPRSDVVTDFDLQYVFDNFEWETEVAEEA